MYSRVKNVKKEKLFYPLDLIVLIVIIAVVAAAIAAAFAPSGNKVEIYVDGNLKYIYDLDENRTVVIDGIGRNVIVIEDGKVRMTEASCTNQICVHNAAISKSGEQIVCLPNKVAVVITGGKGGELDATT